MMKIDIVKHNNKKIIKIWLISKFIILLEIIEQCILQFIKRKFIMEKIERYEKKIFQNKKIQFLLEYLIIYLSSKITIENSIEENILLKCNTNVIQM